jgi:hypothetical protein
MSPVPIPWTQSSTMSCILTVKACFCAEKAQGQAISRQGNGFAVETIQLGEITTPFHSEPTESLSSLSMPSAMQTKQNTVQVPGRFVTSPGDELTRYRQLMKDLESIRFVQPMRTPTPEPTARFGSAPASFAGRPFALVARRISRAYLVHSHLVRCLRCGLLTHLSFSGRGPCFLCVLEQWQRERPSAHGQDSPRLQRQIS